MQKNDHQSQEEKATGGAALKESCKAQMRNFEVFFNGKSQGIYTCRSKEAALRCFANDYECNLSGLFRMAGAFPTVKEA